MWRSSGWMLRLVTLCLLIVIATGCTASRGQRQIVSHARQRAEAKRLHARALAHIDKGGLDRAAELLMEAIAHDPGWADAYNNLGAVEFERERLGAAADHFERAMQLQSDRPEPRNNLAMVYEAAARYDLAARYYAQAHELAPQDDEYRGNLARARVRRGDRDADVIALLREIELRDNRPEWRRWARTQLLRLEAEAPDGPPTPVGSL